MEKILLHPIKGQLRPIRGALQGWGIRGDHLAGKMQKFRRQHGVVDLRDRLPLRRSRPSLCQGTVPCFTYPEFARFHPPDHHNRTVDMFREIQSGIYTVYHDRCTISSR